VTALSKRGRVSNAEGERRGKLNDWVSRSKGEKVVWWASKREEGRSFSFEGEMACSTYWTHGAWERRSKRDCLEQRAHQPAGNGA
jgi:hypothetical protein